MDCEVNAAPMQDGSCIGMEEDMDDAAMENEKCGICMDNVIDRGVLDCCNHWFCFACIDNWATITNFCPLCQNEFQLITCIPVYDTIGRLKGEECTISRDDDWSVQGKNNTLSFPSYYIDEDAVACLGDEGCRVQDGFLTAEDGLALDTSIACDSCDVWYHAYCVGFDPNGSYENSWLCPRCNVAEVSEKSDAISSQKSSKNCPQEVTSSVCPTQTTFSGKLAVSVADAGETAVVVSLVEGKQLIDDGQKDASEILSGVEQKYAEALPIVLSTNKYRESVSKPALCFLDDYGCSNLQTGDSVSSHAIESPNAFPCGEQGNAHVPSHMMSHDKIHVCADGDETSLSLSLSKDLLLFSSSRPSDHSETKSEPIHIGNMCKTPGPNFDASVVQDAQPLDNGSTIDLNLDLMVQPCFPVQDNINNTKEFEESSQKNLDDVGLNRKCMEKARDVMQLNDRTEHSQTFKENETRTVHKKRTRLERNVETPFKSEDGISGSDSLGRYSKLVNHSKNKKVIKTSRREESSCDIMSLVKEVDDKNAHELANPMRGARATKCRENAAGLRIKKIMRRGMDDNEASQLVQKIKKEIDDAVNNEALQASDKGELVDLKLLTAFRAAIARPNKEQDKKAFSSLAKAKKSLLQKGKIREKITRKLYGTANGRRRRAWDRDWEIEFWKHRCLHTKPEKVETLQSVLELLRKNPESWSEEWKIEHKHEEEDENPILSRLYLADASVLPRKEEIKPLSALTGSSKDGQEKMNCSSDASEIIGVISSTKMPKQSSSTLPHGTSPSKMKVSSQKLHRGRPAQGLCVSSTPISQDTHKMKGVPATADVVKAEKQKWALAVLARKTATLENDRSGEKQEDKHYLHGKFPLLAQLPADMRPMLAHGRQSKVPISVRQVQLNRLIEHYLKNANLPIIHRCAETELAVADALNVEKQICERSKSRIVYLNLCSQALSQYVTVGDQHSESEETLPYAVGQVVEGSLKEGSCGHESDSVTQALLQAGLLSESPPISPYRLSEDTDDQNDPAAKDRDNGCEDVLNLDSRPEIDIYGDFDYDLDEDFMGLSGIGNSLIMSKSEIVVTDSKMKVVLNTLNCEKDSVVTESVDTGKDTSSEGEKVDKIGLESELLDRQGLVKHNANHDYMKLVETWEDKGQPNSMVNMKDVHPNEANNDLSVSEYEELYGRDEDHLPQKVSGMETSNYLNECIRKQATGGNIVDEENEKCKPNKLEMMPQIESEGCAENNVVETGGPVNGSSSRTNNSPTMMSENAPRKGPGSNHNQMDHSPIYKKVEAYIKEHIRPLCKSGVITVEQYRWAVNKTTDKVMQYHYKAKNADFLIKEGPKVRKLAEQYVESAKQKCSQPPPLHGK